MQRTTLRLLAASLASALAGAVLAGAVLADGSGDWSGPRLAATAVIAVISAALVLASLALAARLRRLERAVRGELVRHRTATDQLRERIRQLEEHTAQQASRLEQSLHQLPDRLEQPLRRAADRAGHELQSRLPRLVYARIEAHADLRALVRPRAPMPPLDDWALDADVMHLVASLLWDHRPELVVECGSGSSSVWLGYLLEQLGTGRVVSLEHDQRYGQAARDLIRAHELADRVEIRSAPLADWTDPAGTSYPWYDRAAVEDLTGIDLLLVDGPPGATGEQARYPAVPVLLPRCSDRVRILLDDAARPDETAISDRWLAEWPELARTAHRRGRAHVFARAPRQPQV